VTARHVTALAMTAVLLAYFGYLMPKRTEALLERLRAEIARDPGARFAFYLRYLRLSVLVVAAFAVTVLVGGEGREAAGVGWPGHATRRILPALVAGLALLNAALGLAWLLGRTRDPAAFDRESQRSKVEFLIPHTRRERALWPLVAFAIGVLEEVVYRGLFVLYAATLLGISPWWLVAPTAVVFGIGHRYQGWLGVVATGAMGLAFGVVTVLTGSLYPAVLGHTAFDLRLAAVGPGDRSPR
jgi:membrane protease YdiL (CAAX protease family)